MQSKIILNISKSKKDLPTKSWKKHPKSSSIVLFFLAAQTAKTEEFMFQNVAYRPTVYKTGVCNRYCNQSNSRYAIASCCI